LTPAAGVARFALHRSYLTLLRFGFVGRFAD